MTNIPFWDTVVTNAAPIILALTGLVTTVGGFYMQYRMMKHQNEKLDRNAREATDARNDIKDQLTGIKNGHT